MEEQDRKELEKFRWIAKQQEEEEAARKRKAEAMAAYEAEYDREQEGRKEKVQRC